MNKSYLNFKFSQNTLFFGSSSLNSLIVFFLLFSSTVFGQTKVTRIYTDWNGYWTSNSTTGVGNRPDDANNLLAFSWGGTTYSTGVNDAVLTAKTVTYNPQNFRALKITTLGSSGYFIQGSMIDGSATTTTLVPSLTGSTATGAELASRLTDGKNGLALGTGVANIKAGTAEFKVGTDNLNLTGIGDGIPDLIVTQVAGTGGTDKFKFVDASGATVGIELSTVFGSVPAVGTYDLDLFKMDGTRGFAPPQTRDIRLVGIETSAFGITAANAAQVDRFVVTFSGASDCAFIAFNKQSMKLAELSLVTKTASGCGKKVGDTIDCSFEITNTGEVPIKDIKLTNLSSGVTLTGANYIANIPEPQSPLFNKNTVTINGKYTITAADVAAGKVVLTANVEGLDPSLNTVYDISGQTNGDDLPTVTVLNSMSAPVVGTISVSSCAFNGSVNLSGLRVSGTLVQTGAVAKNYPITGTTMVISGLTAGTYNYSILDGCGSSTAVTVVISTTSKTWDAGVWSPSAPTVSDLAIIKGNYNTAANGDIKACSLEIWNGGVLTITAGKFVNIQNDLTVNAGGTLDVLDQGSLVMVNDLGVVINNGTSNVRRTTMPYRNYDYVYWSTPVATTNIPTTFAGWKTSYAFEYKPELFFDSNHDNIDDNGDDWARATTITPAKGFIVMGLSSTPTTTSTITFNGKVNNGVQKITGVIANGNYLIGNPYPSALNADEFLFQNKGVLDGTLAFWTHNTAIQLASGIEAGKAGSGVLAFTSDDYAYYNLTGGVGTGVGQKNASGGTSGGVIPNGKIASCQGFFAATKGVITGANDIVFNNSMRLSTGSDANIQFFKTSNSKAKTASSVEKHRVWLNLTNDKGAFKQTLVGYITGATNDYDGSYDGETLDANEYVDFYSVNQNKKLVIQGRALPFDENDEVPIGFRSSVSNEFSISIQQIDGVLANQSVYLEDKLTNVVHDLNESAYTFTTEKGTFNDRFVLKYKNIDKTLATTNFDTQGNKVLVSVKNRQIKINSFAEKIKNVVIYDMSGRQVYQKEKVNSNELAITDLAVSHQVLIVKTTLENGTTAIDKVVY